MPRLTRPLTAADREQQQVRQDGTLRALRALDPDQAAAWVASHVGTPATLAEAKQSIAVLSQVCQALVRYIVRDLRREER